MFHVTASRASVCPRLSPDVSWYEDICLVKPLKASKLLIPAHVACLLITGQMPSPFRSRPTHKLSASKVTQIISHILKRPSRYDVIKSKLAPEGSCPHSPGTWATDKIPCHYCPTHHSDPLPLKIAGWGLIVPYKQGKYVHTQTSKRFRWTSSCWSIVKDNWLTFVATISTGSNRTSVDEQLGGHASLWRISHMVWCD